MRFPSRLEVFVSARGAGLPNILVWFNLRALGEEVFRGTLGLTNKNGQVALTRRELEDHYREAQEAFPMDYKLSLEDYDDDLVVAVEGGRTFMDHQRIVATEAIVAPRWKTAWAAALNGTITSAVRVVPTQPGDIVVRLDVERTAL